MSLTTYSSFSEHLLCLACPLIKAKRKPYALADKSIPIATCKLEVSVYGQ
jgi:hypothetical protein